MSAVVDCTKETIETLKKKVQIVEDLDEKMRGLSAIIEYYDSHIKELSEVAFIQLIADLIMSGEHFVHINQHYVSYDHFIASRLKCDAY